MSKPLSDRAKHRLNIAAGLIRYDPTAPKDSPEYFDQVQAKLLSIEAEKRDKIRSLVNWVEAYDRAGEEATQAETTAAETKGARRNSGRAPR